MPIGKDIYQSGHEISVSDWREARLLSQSRVLRCQIRKEEAWQEDNMKFLTVRHCRRKNKINLLFGLDIGILHQ
jgi:hypothetical protein